MLVAKCTVKHNANPCLKSCTFGCFQSSGFYSVSPCRFHGCCREHLCKSLLSRLHFSSFFFGFTATALDRPGDLPGLQGCYVHERRPTGTRSLHVCFQKQTGREADLIPPASVLFEHLFRHPELLCTGPKSLL